MSSRPIVFVIPLVVALISAILLYLSIVNGWLGTSSIANRYFCEFSRTGLIKEPVNTWSNLAFVAAGLAIAWLLMKGRFQRNDNALTRNDAIAILFSSLPILLGFGSMAMHATETELGGDLDMLSMYLNAAFMTAYAMQRFFGWGWLRFLIAFLLVVALCEWAGTFYSYIPVIDYAGDAAFAVFISLSVFFEVLNGLLRKIPRQNRWGIYALISFLAAFAVWNLGKNDCPFCSPDSWLQPHALWHLLVALSLFFLFCFYASENPEGANEGKREALASRSA